MRIDILSDLRRTVAWAFRLDGTDDKFSAESNQDLMQAFLDDDNLLMLLVNQHSNVLEWLSSRIIVLLPCAHCLQITHPKVLSAPLGVVNAKEIWSMAHRILLTTDSRY